MLACYLAALGGIALAQAPSPPAIPSRDVDNFVRAETDLYMSGMLKDNGGALGKINHRREVASVDNQTVIRLKRTRCIRPPVRPRRRAGDHAARRGQALPLHAGDQ
jgi:hypothetical protein